jgi:very-short-patch-repair endonuclease
MARDASRFTHTAQQTARARTLRKSMTRAEKLLWSALRANQLGVAFRRQHPIGQFVADFCCVPLKLVIELDGGQHAARTAEDLQRTDHLRTLGFDVIRFWNNDVVENLDGVCREIQAALQRRRFELKVSK